MSAMGEPARNGRENDVVDGAHAGQEQPGRVRRDNAWNVAIGGGGSVARPEKTVCEDAEGHVHVEKARSESDGHAEAPAEVGGAGAKANADEQEDRARHNRKK
jgi:hypothetical protein